MDRDDTKAAWIDTVLWLRRRSPLVQMLRAADIVLVSCLLILVETAIWKFFGG